MDRLHYRLKTKFDDDSRGIRFYYTFSLVANGTFQEIGWAELYYFEDFFNMREMAQLERLDAISAGGLACYEGITDKKGNLKRSIRRHLISMPNDLVYLEHLEVTKPFRKNRYGERIMRLLVKEHSEDMALFALTASPIDIDDLPDASDSEGPEYKKALEILTNKLIGFYKRVGFVPIRNGETPMFLPHKISR